MSDLNTQILIGADATGVEAGVGKAKRSLKDLGDSAKRSGKEAADGLGAVGVGAEKSARQIAATTRSIERDLQKQIAAYQAGSTSSRQYQETMAKFRGADVNALKPWLDQLDAAKRKSDDLVQANTKLGGSFDGLRAAASVTARALGALGVGLSVNELIKMADASTNIASRLTLVTSSSVELARVQKELFQIAQASRVSFVDLVGTYAQVARSTKDLGISQTALLGVIKTISQAVTISGGSAASAQAALTQLSQGFASGALRGEELNSILEQTPRLAQAIADGLGVTVGKLRELGQAGELTANAVLGALEKSAAKVSEEFGKMTTTVEQASTQATNSVLRLVGAFDKLSGATSFVSNFITKLSEGIDFLSKDVEKLGSQGPLRAAADEVLELDRRATILRNGLRNGFYGPKFQKELDDVNVKLAEAKRRFNELDAAMGGPDPRDQSGFVPRGTSYANEAARQKQLREDGNKFLLKQSGVPDSYIKDMNELIRLNQEGVIVGDAYTAALKKQQEVLLQKTGVTKGVAAAINEEQNAYESLIASIRAKVDEDKLELQGGQNLSESQRMRIKLDQDLRAGRVKLNGAHEASIRAAIAEKEVTEQALKVYKEALKVSQDRQTARNKETDSIEAWTRAQEAAADQTEKSITARISSLEGEEEAVALARDTNISLAEAIERVAIARLREKRDGPTGVYKDSPAYKELTDEIELREKLASGIGGKEFREKSEDAAKKSAEDWKRTADSINQDLTDAFVQSFESGEDLGKNLAKSLKNIFANTVLRPVISGIMAPISGGLTNLLGGGGLGGAAGGGSNLMGMASNASTLYSGYQALTATGGNLGAISGFASGTMSGANALGSIYANSVGGGLDALLATNGAYGTASGGAAAAGGIGSFAAGGIAAAIMLAVINVLGGMRSETMIGSGLAGTLGGDKALTPWQEWREGGTLLSGPEFATHNPLEELSSKRAELQAVRDRGDGATNYAVGLQAIVTDLEKTTKGLAEQTEVFNREIGKGYKAYLSNVMDMADSLGLAGSSIEDFAYTLGAQDLNFQGLNPEQIQAKIAETFGKAGDAATKTFLGSWKEVTDTVINTYVSEQQTQASDGAFVTDTTVTKRMEYQASVYAKTGETAIDTLTRLATSFNTLNEASDALGFGIQKGSLALADFSDKFIEAFGGLEKFAASTGAFLQNYYTDAERRDYLIRSGVRQAEKLGIQGLTEDSLRNGSREQFRDFVNSAATNPELYADALDLANYLSPIFASFEEQAPVVQEVANVVDELTQAYQNAVKSLKGDADSLAVELLRAQGNESGAKSLERTQYLAQFAGLDEARRKEIETLYDGNMATRAYIQGIKDAATAQLDALAKLRADSLALIDGAAGKTDAAFAAYERAADKERERLQGTIDTIKSVFQAAQDGAKSFFGEVEAVAKFQGAEGRDFISQALASVQAGGALPDGEKLSDAIAAVGKDFSTTQYASQAEADFQRLVVANELKGLQDVSGDQLTTAEEQLEALNQQVEWARDQVNLLRGIDSSLKDLPTAIANLIAAYNNESQTRSNVGAKAIIGSGSAVYDKASGVGTTSSGVYFERDALIQAAQETLAANPNASGANSVYDALESGGFTLAQYNDMFGMPPGTLEAEARALGRPIFHSGTTRVPETGFALLQKDEAVIPAAFNPWVNGGAGGMGDNTAVVNEIRALRDDNRAQAGQLIRLQMQLNKVLKQWDGEGLPEEREMTA